jgi:hypothetical protein
MMNEQPTLWTIQKPKKSIRERFVAFHNGNPKVYEGIVEIAMQMQDRGVKKMGISLIFERLRWLHFIEVNSDDGFKLSNDYRAEYARLIMTREPHLEGFFETRALRRQV